MPRKRKPTAQDFADMRDRKLRPAQWRTRKEEIHREHLAFLHMGHYLYYQEKALARERYITALFGCKTSWPIIQARSIYFNVEHKT